MLTDEPTGENITVRAFPLYAILKAIDVPVIDYFSLDIEGVELEVSGSFLIIETEVALLLLELEVSFF